MSPRPPSDGEGSKSPSNRNGVYEVGYRRPPKSGQFKPGQSGNPKGRRKREDTIAGALRAELAATQKVRENGKEKTLTKAEILVKQWVRQAIEGKPTAIIQIAKLEPKLFAQAVAAATGPDPAVSGEITETDVEMMRWLLKGLDSEDNAPAEDFDPDAEGADV